MDLLVQSRKDHVHAAFAYCFDCLGSQQFLCALGEFLSPLKIVRKQFFDRLFNLPRPLNLTLKSQHQTPIQRRSVAMNLGHLGDPAKLRKCKLPVPDFDNQ